MRLPPRYGTPYDDGRRRQLPVAGSGIGKFDVVAATGQSGDGVGAFGEAHYMAIGAEGEIFVADPVSGEVEKFVRR